MTTGHASGTCTSHDGRPKRAFPGRHAAEHAARISRSESGQPARVYRCPVPGHGWHVTTTELLWRGPAE